MIHDAIKIVYLGIDVHKKTYSVTAISNNTVIKRASMPADFQILLSFIKKNFEDAEVYSAYEAGFSGFGLHRFLLANNVNNIVIHAASIETQVHNKVKNDKRDSLKIANQLSYGRLTCVNIPTPQREVWRSISRLRSQMVQERTRFSCRIKSFLYYFSLLPHNHTKKASRKWIQSLLTRTDLQSDVFYCIRSNVEAWLYFDNEIKKINMLLKEQGKRDSKIGDVYMKMKGIGLISSRILANELDDLSQFHSETALYGFTGLTPCEYSSGETKRLGRISRQGNPVIRQILVEAAWKAIYQDEKLGEVFDRLVRNTGSRKKAIVGVARRMIGHTRAAFKKESLVCMIK